MKNITLSTNKSLNNSKTIFTDNLESAIIQHSENPKKPFKRDGKWSNRYGKNNRWSVLISEDGKTANLQDWVNNTTQFVALQGFDFKNYTPPAQLLPLRVRQRQPGTVRRPLR